MLINISAQLFGCKRIEMEINFSDFAYGKKKLSANEQSSSNLLSESLTCED